MARTRTLLTAAVGPTLLRLAGPMAVGIAAIIMFMVVDTIYVGQLGAVPLAAMSFCFPVIFVVYSVTMGIGTGTTSVIARALGEGDRDKVRRLTTHALYLAFFVVVAVAGIGLATMDWLFTAMGAEPHVLSLIHAYMTPWFLGVGLLVIPMVGNSAIRATGDTKSPSVIMVIAGLVNVVLDPVLIFGLGPFPRLELQGAAIATVISWVVSFAAAMYLLGVRERLLVKEVPRLRELWASWRAVLYVGLPAAATNLLIPLSTGILTRLVSTYGTTAVAAFGVGTRLEAMAMIGVNALSTALTPFVGQNFGAGEHGRIRDALTFSVKCSLTWGVGAAILLGGGAAPLARLFNDHPDITLQTTQYLQLIPVSYGLLGIGMLTNTTFIALGRPLSASLIIAIRLFVLAVPLAFLGSRLLGLRGLFMGISLGNALISVVALLLVRRTLTSFSVDRTPTLVHM